MNLKPLLGPAAAVFAAFALGGCASLPNSAPAASASPVGTYWKLVEVNGQPVPQLNREPHLILQREGRRATGFAGCNGFGASYEIDEAKSRIRFEHIAGTMMACPDGMAVEQAFHEALRGADNYSLSGDGRALTLNKARMAPLARFVAAAKP